MSSHPTRISRSFCISLDDGPQTLSIDVTVLDAGDVHLDVRSEDLSTGRSRVLDVRILGPASESGSQVATINAATVHTPHRSATASSSRVAPAMPPLHVQGRELNTEPQPTASISRLSPLPAPAPTITQQALPPPPYSQSRQPTTPPVAPDHPTPNVQPPLDIGTPMVYRAPGTLTHHPPDAPRVPSPPPLRTWRDLAEAMQRGEFVPQILPDEPEEEELPLNLGRCRRNGEYSDDENEDEEDRERYAKRSRVSWGPLEFLRPGRSL
ncbi:hypothetical protein B0H17DRAFT_1141816 [Mycena rosella]|uniref:Uncharacterized protein n=1 Tax=Mycena rosella TaxID=1033263 RepID=A0AAD7CYX0_MYCRO|nr:hypothetical protein B0H17DRAFT_1141816 [Mycena rosella]